MCLAMPAAIIECLPDDRAIADVGGVRREISLSLVEGVKPGDYVIVHVGYALSRLDPDEAQRTLGLFKEMNDAGARERAAG